ncbi:MAG: flavin reductase family protein [Microbacteriaceae bacterium]
MSETRRWTHPWADVVLDRDDGSIPVVAVPPAPSDPAAVRGMFAQLPTGIAAICAEVDGTPQGMVATSLSVGASFAPPLALLAVQRESRTWPRIAAAPRLGVSVLAEANAAAVRALASREGDRFAGVDIARSREGAAFVRGARLWLECRIVSEQELGDHRAIVLEVLGASSLAGASPLVYLAGRVLVAPDGAPEEPEGEGASA